MKEIYRSYINTEVTALATEIECPNCHNEWWEDDASDCGVTYKLTCEDCGERFEMHFDAD